ncbi:hypothetical protein AaE_012687 [Aphanomyces astaci]|uniref:HTH CENPB-type domain-containing protein n=1 Tax=Aphanomyces astaci TaxID=112090 RepID=A0A6A4ZB52_APHAT|nr:hypothetical protein AaE_012687 [Aphanomyces astaci]
MARYKRQELDRAVALVIGGAKGTDVARDTQIPYNTLMNNVRATKAGKTRKRMGPPTALPDTCELDLVAWIGAMQRDGYPPDRQAIMVKATQLLRKIDATRTTLSSGWYKRFRNRFPMLTKRVAQVISHARNSVDEQGVTRLFGSITKTIAENKITADRIYNMDETAFVSRKKSGTVIAMKGSQNVWAKTVTPSFHLSIVACVSASGSIFPPLFLFPGETVEKVLSAECSVPKATISTSPKGFMNEDVFASWIKHFSSNITVSRPVLLIFDGLASHYSQQMVELCTSLQIILLCLPSNATHLFQPLDVAVFGPYKTAIRKAIVEEMVNDETGALHTISRAAALRIASAAWKDRILPANAVAGFKATGLWPLSKVQMMKRFNLFKEGGVPKSYLEAFWIERREALRSEMLRLPAKSKKKTSGRKTIDVGGRILTVELLSEIDKSKEDRQAASMQKAALQKKRGKRGKNGKRITLSKVALKWAAIAATYGLKPLPSGQIRSIDNGDNEVVV